MRYFYSNMTTAAKAQNKARERPLDKEQIYEQPSQWDTHARRFSGEKGFHAPYPMHCLW
jgi:hypothetical protein